MHKDTFFRDSILLSASNLITGVLGFMFAIILSKALGPEGMGLYGLIMPVYNLFICLISGGMVTAISKVAAVYFSKNDYNNLNKSIKVSMVFDFLWGGIVIAFVLIFSAGLSKYVIKDIRTLNALRIICPAMIFIALSSILKGYFYGVSKIKIPAVIDIFEKGFRIFLILSLINIFKLKTITSTVTAAYGALSIGEFISLVLLYINYKISKSQLKPQFSKSENSAQLLFNILVISFPLCLNGFLSTALSTASTLIVPRRLVSAGLDYSNALSLIGKFTGMTLNITFFPIIIINSMCTILIPELSQSISRKDYFSAESRINEVVKISFLLGISTAAICAAIPNSLGKLFFSRTDLGSYIRFVSMSIPLTYVTSTSYGILNGMGKQKILLRNSLIVSVAELIFLYIFTGIPSINIYGYGITMLLTALISLVINFSEIKKTFYLKFDIFQFIIYILNAVLLYILLIYFNNLIPDTYFTFKTVLIIACGFITFFIMVLISNKNQIA